MSDTISIMRRTPFPPTAWTEIEAVRGDGESARQALDALCDVYYAPVFGFISRKIRDPHRAQDLTQEFFARLLGNRALIEKADRSRGKFRSFLSQRLQWFILDHFKKDMPESREQELNDTVVVRSAMPDTVEDPEFNIEWAKQTLNKALDQLEAKYHAEGKETRRQIFMHRRSQKSASDIATALNETVDKIKNELRIIKQDSEVSLKAVVRATVRDDSFVEEEIREIRRLLSLKTDLERGRFIPAQPGPELEKQHPN